MSQTVDKSSDKTNTQQKERFQIRIFIFPIIMIAVLTAFDQLTKYIIAGIYKLYESKNIIPHVLSFTYIRNTGVAWGMFKGKRIIFLLLTVITLLFCVYIYSNIADNKKYRLLRISLIVLISGALGNMIDRIKLGYVIDFFDVDFMDFPVFNVADIYVVVSMIALFLLLIFKYDNDEFEEILGVHSKDKNREDKVEINGTNTTDGINDKKEEE